MSLARSSLLFASGTFLSRTSGLIRDMVVVGVYGASVYVDAFLVAFRIPNLFREMVAEGALGNAFTKVFSSLWEEDRERAVKLLIQSLYLATIVSILLCLLGIVLSPQLVHVMTLMAQGEGSKPELVHNAVGLSRIMFPYLGLAMVGSILMGALHQRGMFFISALSPLAFNIGNIIGATVLAQAVVYFAPSWFASVVADPKITGLALGVLLGGVGHFMWQFIVVFRAFLKSTKINLRQLPWSNDVKNVLVIMWPATVAASTGPINLFINTNFATSAGEGAVSWLNFAFRILQLPIGLFGVAVGAAALPQLSRALARAGRVVNEEVTAHFQKSIELVLWLTAPCMVYVLLNSEPIIQLLFQHGQFTARDSFETGRALYAYGYGMLAYGLIKVLTSFYYAVERTSFAMKMAIIGISINFIGNYLLVSRFGHVGLAMTSSITLSFNALFLIAGLIPHRLAMDWGAILKTLGLLALGAVVCYVVETSIHNWLVFWNYGGMNTVKLRAGTDVLANGLATVLIFGVLGLWRLRKSPRQALALIKGLRGRRSV